MPFGLLQGPHAVQGLASQEMEVASRGGVVHREKCRRGHHLCVPTRLAPWFGTVPARHSLLKEAPHFPFRFPISHRNARPGQQIRIICMAGAAPALLRPLQTDAIQKCRRLFQGQTPCQRFIGTIGADMACGFFLQRMQFHLSEEHFETL
ncbi:hypothetical protein HRbin36_02780 [bacterium HR36]|nr:hypothetical protein HRbin36_02780 [bacterium HR36]